jgi:hypothetical protein
VAAATSQMCRSSWIKRTKSAAASPATFCYVINSARCAAGAAVGREAQRTAIVSDVRSVSAGKQHQHMPRTCMCVYRRAHAAAVTWAMPLCADYWSKHDQNLGKLRLHVQIQLMQVPGLPI